MRFALVVLVSVMSATSVSAHHSASYWRSFHEIRYLVCIEKPATKYDCVGVRAKRELLAALKSTDKDQVRDAAVAASYFNVTEAVPLLRPLLDDVDVFLKVEAAYALAHLGDKQSSAKLLDLVKDMETNGRGTLWSDALEALGVIDPPAASRYAIDFISRVRDFRMSMPGGSSKELAFDYIRPEHRADALPILERLAKAEENKSTDHTHCLLMAARVRLDDALRASVRKQFLTSYGGTWLAGCANAVIAELGVEPEDAAALVRHLGRDDNGMDYGMANISYRRILELIVAMDAMPASSAVTKAREILRKGLVERNTWPHIANPTHRNYSLHFVAFHRAALAGLGDADARRALYELVDSQDDEGNAWIGAYWALRLRVADATDHAAGLAKRSLQYQNSGKGDVYRDIRVRMLDAFADNFPSDPRWTILMLDPDRDAAEHALYRFARAPTAKACEVVTNAARSATADGTEHALLDLTMLGTQCLPAIESLFLDRNVTGEVRGTALEFLAVLESPKICEHLARARAESVWEPAIQRAELLVTRSCKAVKVPKQGPVDQPLPPRTHRQGL
jgi:hypothetical protein